ncbi:DUF6129 family protein [Marichromatium sp. AB31]|uniref:DUF6129 family protein n=1 Tax=Marichromatium sp. AB31 TaxID=2483362 RepID=UPI000F3E6D47|nr:DUF6129 family protein [Marichromatium sp. AB31]MBO8085677.1 hypothetical protein [Marichromatium sp.]RNE90642.1 hypothetical protein EBL84_06940 [Marichromatium sp. AB31]
MIAPERIEQVVAVVSRIGVNAQTVQALRESFDELHFTLCLEDEVGVREPYRELPGVSLYLVGAGASGCAALTDDPAEASGLLLATHA